MVPKKQVRSVKLEVRRLRSTPRGVQLADFQASSRLVLLPISHFTLPPSHLPLKIVLINLPVQRAYGHAE